MASEFDIRNVRRPVPTTPPPAGTTPQVRGGPRVVPAVNPRGQLPQAPGSVIDSRGNAVPLTELERRELAEVGLDPATTPIGQGLAGAIAAVREARRDLSAAELSAVYADHKPPAEYAPRPLSALTDADRVRIRRENEEMVRLEREAAANTAAAAQGGVQGDQVAAIAAAAEAYRAPAATPRGVTIVNDVSAHYAKQEPAPTQDPPRAEGPAPVAAAGAGAPPGNCPHCQWPLDVTDDTEPTREQALEFLQAQLGGVPFVWESPLFGGAVRVAFRTLTRAEIDTIFQQAGYEEERGVLRSAGDFNERVMRFRLALQLYRFRGGARDIALAAGLSAETNPKAPSHWRADEPEDRRETILPQIDEYVAREVLNSETIYRVTQHACLQFNRLVGKLEALAETPDFWSATGSGS